MRGFNLDQLKAFVDVAELGSFSAAAQRANLSQPAISLQVRQLERRLGVQLIERVGRRARPTSAGVELLAHAARIDGAVGAALDSMAKHATGVAGRVRIGTGATACIYLLPPVLRNLKQRFPSLEITVSTGNTGEFVKAVEENVLDLGLVTLPVSSRALESIPVVEDEFVVAAPGGTELPESVDAGTLAGMPIIAFEPGGSTRRIADEWFSRGGVAARPLMSLGSVEAIKELVGAGLGCAILPGMAVRSSAAAERLTVRSMRPRLHRTLGIIVRRDKRLHRGLKETITALQGRSE